MATQWDRFNEHGVNVGLMRHVLDHVLQHPESHNQEVWRLVAEGESHPNRCGTVMCFAGHVADQAGGKWLAPADDEFASHLLVPESGDSRVDVKRWHDCIGVPVDRRANRLLGLTFGHDLFSAYATTADLVAFVELAESGATPDELSEWYVGRSDDA